MKQIQEQTVGKLLLLVGDHIESVRREIQDLHMNPQDQNAQRIKLALTDYQASIEVQKELETLEDVIDISAYCVWKKQKGPEYKSRCGKETYCTIPEGWNSVGGAPKTYRPKVCACGKEIIWQDRT